MPSPLTYRPYLLPLTILVLLVLSAALVIVFSGLNRGNRAVLTATATVVAAIVFYVLNTATSLSESRRSSTFVVELAVDRLTNFLGADVYSLQQSVRALLEGALVENLKAAQPNLLKEHEDIVRRDFIIASTLKWLAHEEFDWQSEATVLKTTQGTITTKGYRSRPDKSLVVTEADLRTMLSSRGNVFANQFTMDFRKEIILPKGSILVVESNSVAIFHPVFDLKIEFDGTPKMTSNDNPRTHRMEMLPDGKPRFSTYIYEAKFTTLIKKFRSGDTDRQRFESWFARLDTSVQSWFEAASNNDSVERIPLGSVLAPAEPKGK